LHWRALIREDEIVVHRVLVCLMAADIQGLAHRAFHMVRDVAWPIRDVVPQLPKSGREFVPQETKQFSPHRPCASFLHYHWRLLHSMKLSGGRK